MNWSDPIVPFQMHPLGFVESFRRYGADARELLIRAGLDPALLDAPDTRISYRQFVRLVRCGMQLCHRPGLGLLIGRHFDWYYYGLPGIAILASTSFKKATAILHRYTCLVQPYYAPYKSRPAFFVDNRQRVIIPIQYLISAALGDETLRRFELEFRTGLLLQILHRFAGVHDKAANVEVQLAMPRPMHLHVYRELAPYDFRFDCESSRFIVPAAMLKTRADHLRTGVCEHVLGYCREELDRAEQAVAWAERVRALLYESIPHYLTQKDAAERLEMTTRTLARKLHQEQTSFTAVLNEVRSEVATYLLNTTTLSVADVAESVGFADTTNFRQAFKRWTGRSARDVREDARAPERPARKPGAASGAAARPVPGRAPPCPR